MLNVVTQNRLRGITHPLVSSMHMKKAVGPGNREEDVLVIEAALSGPEDDYDTFDSHLTDLLIDLERLKEQAENCVGKFDRVDIRTH